MNKRHFLGTAAIASLAPYVGAQAADPVRKGPGLMTISGAIGKTNRGPLDPALDQLLVKHGVKFDKAFVVDAEALRGLPAVRIKPTLEYDAKPHVLSGPLLTGVLELAGVPTSGDVLLAMRAVDGYVVPVKIADARNYKMIVATEIDGAPLALGGLGPQWAVYEADTLTAFKDKPLKERFALCPWGLYSIEVTPG
ncbi:molybdopterin-dependent oxidoreductase [Variovorax sp. KK3]|uniref:molybdopterin-dependent oxidoreductase n=1 Tax=Variovorax sp. KK3 TaxID=1855728 RepID=UPI00097C7B26|nr:molybdopterin-dependent oxidoreductase [Variovorax sp. KK3]